MGVTYDNKDLKDFGMNFPDLEKSKENVKTKDVYEMGKRLSQS